MLLLSSASAKKGISPIRAFLGLLCIGVGVYLITKSSTEDDATSDAGEEQEIVYLTQREAIAQTRAALERELEDHGGWAAWVEATREFRSELAKYKYSTEKALDHRPAFEGYNGLWINPRQLTGRIDPLTLTSSVSPEIKHSSAVVDSVVRFQRFLNAKGTDLIFVPLPGRCDVYPELYSTSAPKGMYPDPYLRAIMLELLKADIEVLDLFEAIFEAKEAAGDELIYYRHDNHPRSAAMRVVASAIAERLMRYASVRDGFSERHVFQEHELDGPKIYEYSIAEDDPEAYTACAECGFTQILTPDGGPVLADDTSPVLIAGDSFVTIPLFGVGRVITPGINLVAHTMGALRMNAAVNMQLGGGPKVPRTLAASPDVSLEDRDVVVWVMCACHLSAKFDDAWRHGSWPPLELND
jgi:hypothetical protein